jgi:hypothetical protein
MLLREFLIKNGIDSLIETYKIKASYHKTYPNLVCLKYSQIDSPMGEKIVQQCRGIIVDIDKAFEIVSAPYDKFFNHGEGHAPEIDWSSASVYEKLDGSLMTLYFYNGVWRVQSSGTPDASGDINGFGITFSELFWKVWKEKNYLFPIDEDLCFMFELMTKYNRVIVPQEHNRLVLHGVRNKVTLEEFDPFEYKFKYGWEVVERLPLASFEDIIESAKRLNPMELEGYVVIDKNFNRIKVKSPQYVALSHMKEGFSSRRMLQLIMANEGEEFLSYFPEWAELYSEIKTSFYCLIDQINLAFERHQKIESQKEFAIAVKDYPFSGILFSLRAGKVNSAKEAISSITQNKLESLVLGGSHD